MSMPRKVRVSCPRGKASLDDTVWESVNTDNLQIFLKGSFLESSFSIHVQIMGLSFRLNIQLSTMI